MNPNIIIISLNEYFYYEPWEKLKEVGKPTLTIFIKKVITSAYSKSSKSAGFNPILQKFQEMICEIIVFKTVCRIFLIFCRSSFINNFMVKSNFRELKNYWKLNILQPIYFLKNLHINLKVLSVKISQENFSFRKMFF